MGRIAVVVVPLLLAGCARGTCRPCVPACVVPAPAAAPAPVVVAPSGPAAQAPPIASPAATRPPAPAQASGPSAASVAEFLAKVEAAAKGENRTEAIATLVRAHPGEARALDLETWAGVAPGGLLVYDLRPFLEGGSDEVIEMAPLGGAATGEAGIGRVERVAMALLPTAFGNSSPAFVLREDGIVLVADESYVASVEAALHRVAVVGGGHVRVRCVAVEDPERVERELGIAAPAPNADPAAPLTAVGTVVSALERVSDEQWSRAAARRIDPPMSVDAVAGCIRGSKRTTTRAYVQDFDVKGDSVAIADPIVGSVEAGFAVNAHLAPVAVPKDVELRFEWTRVVTPMQTFRTNLLGPSSHSTLMVELDLPELRAVNGRVLVPAKVGAGAFLRFGSLVGVLARVESVTSGPEPKAAWRRVHPAPLAALLSLPGERAQHFLDMHVRTRRVGASEATEVTAPKLLVLEGQEASISIAEQISYVADFDVEVATPAVIADPIVGSIQTGLTIGARVLSRADGTVAIDGTVTVADVQMPMRRVTTTLGVGAPVTIDLPTTRQAVESFRVIAKDGEPVTLTLSVPTKEGPTEIQLTIVWRRLLPGVSKAPK